MNWRRTKEYRHWRVAVIRRDGKCVICGCRQGRQAHHIENGQHHPESRYDVGNGVTLCKLCHRQLHTNFKRSYRCKTTRADWENFQELARYFIGTK